MKCIIILLVVCLFVAVAYGGNKQWKEECAKENNIDRSAKNKTSTDYKCYKRCLAVKKGLLDESGEPKYEIIKTKFKINDAVMEDVKRCTSTNANKCEKYAEIEACIKKIVKSK